MLAPRPASPVASSAHDGTFPSSPTIRAPASMPKAATDWTVPTCETG